MSGLLPKWKFLLTAATLASTITVQSVGGAENDNYNKPPNVVNPLTSQILTRSTVLPSMDTMDAGDVIECYTLVRMAPLENESTLLIHDSENSNPLNNGNADSSGSNNNNNNNNILVTKSALAFRYKPKSTSLDAAVKSPFELVLEYGPQRTGPTQSNEAVSVVGGTNAETMYLSWENHAKIYYTLSINKQEDYYTNAYYMAPITGAVLSKILDYILDYPGHHPRYQPFTVVAKNRRVAESVMSQPIIRSSNSDDFVWDVLYSLKVVN